MGRVMLVSSQKEDIGKTVTSIKLGYMLSKKGKNVLLMDFSAGKRKMSEYLDADENIIYDIKDVMDATCSLNLAVLEIKENLSLLPCPRLGSKLDNIKKSMFNKLITSAKKDYDVIICDIDKIQNTYLDLNVVDDIITINNNDFSCIKEINIDKSILDKYNFHNVHVLINKYNKKLASKGTMMKLKDIQNLSELKILAEIEENTIYNQVDTNFFLYEDDNSFHKSIDIIIKNLK